MKCKLLFYFFVLCFCGAGCTQESALSDVELKDPSAIRPEIVFSKAKENGSITQYVYAWINDKNNDPVELKNGGVLLNGKEMQVKTLQGLPYYSGLDIISDIRAGYIYNVGIKLNSEKTYSASIKIPDKDLSTLTLPLSQNRNQDMVISWTEIDPNRELKLDILNYYRKDNQEQTEEFPLSIPQESLSQGKHTIPSSYFKNTENVYKTKITLISTVKGTIYEGFRAGSKIEATISIAKSCQVY
ncbi:MAG: hypothetical protein HF314_03455 [Ignavibacteria bacterium]|jgi:hypothetical protein|nr:hypothetical protein [Ignavibacteria bacterium]MCU7502107.1 hypothetical protein [Ignavibacteria bacterium]MCU7515509.1 hypothetical protein [Ignavibacteria bacterium]